MAIAQVWRWKSARRARLLTVWRLITQIAGRSPQPADRSADTASPIAAFESLMRGHERDVFSYLWRLTGDEQTAYDLCQEMFLRAWQHFATMSRYDQPGAWLFRVATNLAINFLKKRKLLTYLAEDAWEATLPVAEDPLHGFVVRDLVHRALLHLQPRYRSALVLREVYGLSSEEVALALGTTHAAANMTLSRAREEFRQRVTYEEGRL